MTCSSWWNDNVQSQALPEFQRFFAASLCGVILDVALSYVLVHSLGLAILVASTVSLFIAAGLMYFVHEHWTFGGDGRFRAGGSSRR
ncbi:hypothetical protein HGG75_28640 [Ochrobactrum pseudogrignonense]|nr:hypothetical protein [Brucella pseudogrignonensis]